MKRGGAAQAQAQAHVRSPRGSVLPGETNGPGPGRTDKGRADKGRTDGGRTNGW